MSALQAPAIGFHSIKPATIPEPPVHPLKAQSLDIEAITSRYEAERAKRLREDGIAQYQHAQGSLSRFKADVKALPLIRDPVTRETKVLIVGGGFGGIVTAVRLKDQGVQDFVILDKAAGFGGTWYWNQYPGINKYSQSPHKGNR